MKFKFSVVLALACILFASPATANNLLGNPGFENGISDWTLDGPNWEIQSDVVFPQGGSIAAKNTVTDIDQDYFASLSQSVALGSGVSIDASLQVKTNIDVRAFARAGLLVQFIDSGDNVIDSIQDEVGGQTDWREMFVQATTPSGTVRVVYIAFLFAPANEATGSGIALGGEAYFDQAVLSTDPLTGPGEQTELLNGSFENGLNDWNLIFQPAFSINTSDVIDGSLALNSTFENGGGDFFTSAFQDLEYLGGDLYASSFIKTNMPANSFAVAGLLLEYYDSFDPVPGSRLDADEVTVSNTNDWQRVLINGVTPPAETVMVRVHVFTFVNDTSANGTQATFDDVIFSYTPLEPVERNTEIINESFENGFTGWSDQFGVPASLVTDGILGDFAASKVVEETEDRDYFGRLFQDIFYDELGSEFPEGSVIGFGGYVKTDFSPLTKSSAGIQVEFIDADGEVILDEDDNPITVENSISAKNNWKYLRINTETPAGTVRVRLSGFVFARQQDSALGGEARFDQFYLSDVPLYIPPPRLILKNADFENGLNNWTESFNPAEITDETVFSGNYAGEFTVDESVLFADYFSQVSQEVRGVGGWMVTAELMVKTDISPFATSTNIGIGLVFLDASGNIVGATPQRIATGVNDWKKIQISQRAPAGTRRVRLNISMFSDLLDNVDAIGAKAYFDKAVMRQYGSGSAQSCFPSGRRRATFGSPIQNEIVFFRENISGCF